MLKLGKSLLTILILIKHMMYSGKHLMDEMEFEESALRHVNLALRSDLWWGAEKEKEEALEMARSAVSLSFCFLSDPDPMHPIKVPLLYPPSLMSASTASLDHLQQHIEYRTMRHQKGSLTYLALCPLAFPLKYISVFSSSFLLILWSS